MKTRTANLIFVVCVVCWTVLAETHPAERPKEEKKRSLLPLDDEENDSYSGDQDSNLLTFLPVDDDDALPHKTSSHATDFPIRIELQPSPEEGSANDVRAQNSDQYDQDRNDASKLGFSSFQQFDVDCAALASLGIYCEDAVNRSEGSTAIPEVISTAATSTTTNSVMSQSSKPADKTRVKAESIRPTERLDAQANQGSDAALPEQSQPNYDWGSDCVALARYGIECPVEHTKAPVNDADSDAVTGLHNSTQGANDHTAAEQLTVTSAGGLKFDENIEPTKPNTAASNDKTLAVPSLVSVEDKTVRWPGFIEITEAGELERAAEITSPVTERKAVTTPRQQHSDYEDQKVTPSARTMLETTEAQHVAATDFATGMPPTRKSVRNRQESGSEAMATTREQSDVSDQDVPVSVLMTIKKTIARQHTDTTHTQSAADALPTGKPGTHATTNSDVVEEPPAASERGSRSRPPQASTAEDHVAHTTNAVEVAPLNGKIPMIILVVCVSLLIFFLLALAMAAVLRARIKRRGKYGVTSRFVSVEDAVTVEGVSLVNGEKVVTVQYNGKRA